jgi:putative addiction module killer protein
MGYNVLRSQDLETKPRELFIYQTPSGSSPFEDWINGLRDVQGRAIVRKRLNRIRLGNFGDSKSVGKGVFELRIDFGPGYRVYFAEQNETIVVLLCGGNKSTQEKDIQMAQQYLLDFLT